MSKRHIDIEKPVMRINTNTQSFNILEIENRRFMFNPKTGTLILGFQYAGGKNYFSHAEEHSRAETGEPYDDFIRGWIGTSKKYPNGIIHFAPNISSKIISMFDKGFSTLEMFMQNGANADTVVRGFGEVWEQPISNLFKEVKNVEQNTVAVKPIELSSTTTKDRVSEILDRLRQGVSDVFESGKYEEYLSVMSKFHHYSFRNSLLIAMQKPDASHVASYGAWSKKFNRQVNRNEKGIKIVAPSAIKKTVQAPVLDQRTKEPVCGADGKPRMQDVEITIPTYRIATVFDISQTSGEPLPTLGVDELTGNVSNYKNFFEAAKALSPVPIEFEHIESGAKGYFNAAEQRIAIQENMSELQTSKTLIHEIAHAMLHNISPEDIQNIPPEERKSRNVREVEAESVAYTVCQHYGLDTSDYSFGYLAGWSQGKELEELEASLAVIQSTANKFINGIDERLAEQVRETAQEKPQVDMSANIRQWYQAEYPTDELGKGISDSATFQQLADSLSDGKVYAALGIGDSVVRERCFTKLAEIEQVDYSVVHDKWLAGAGQDKATPEKDKEKSGPEKKAAQKKPSVRDKLKEPAKAAAKPKKSQTKQKEDVSL